MERAGKSPADLVKKSGGEISFARITNWKRGDNDPSKSLLPMLAEFADTTVSDLLGSDSAPETDVSPRPRKHEGRFVSLAGTPLKPVKIVGATSAGPGTYVVDPTEDLIYVPARLADLGGLGWVVDGESMMPALQPGDVAIFREWRTPRKHYTFLIRTRKGEFKVKNMEWLDNQWVLVSLSPNYPPEPLGDSEILGYLMGWYRARGSRETLDSDPNGLLLTDE